MSQKWFGLVALQLLLAINCLPACWSDTAGEGPDDEPTVEQLLRSQGIKALRQSPKTDHGPLPLKGEVRVSKQLPPIKEKAKDGAVLAEDILKSVKLSAKQDDEWYWIPKWSAGFWETKSSDLFYGYDYKDKRENKPYKAKFDSTTIIGYQFDSRGEIWTSFTAPFFQVLDSDNFRETTVVQELRPAYVGSDRVTTYTRGLRLRTDLKTNKLLLAYQYESVSTVVPTGTNKTTTITTLKMFDLDGKPIGIQRNSTEALRTQDFYPTDVYRAQDLRISFCKFLKRKDLENLIPFSDLAHLPPPRKSPYYMGFAEWGNFRTSANPPAQDPAHRYAKSMTHRLLNLLGADPVPALITVDRSGKIRDVVSVDHNQTLPAAQVRALKDAKLDPLPADYSGQIYTFELKASAD